MTGLRPGDQSLMDTCVPLKGPVPLLRAAWEEDGQTSSLEDQRWDKDSVVRTRQGGRDQMCMNRVLGFSRS